MGNENYFKQLLSQPYCPICHKYNILNVYDSYKLEVDVFMYQYFRICCLVLLIRSFQNVLIYMIITQEIGATSIRLEIKRSLLIKQPGLQVPGIQLTIMLKKQFQPINFRNHSNHF